ncbi:MAG: hypothetical protein RLZZ129_754 [Verrucomicrobiota bacterium]|jgi:hypothetical protein
MNKRPSDVQNPCSGDVALERLVKTAKLLLAHAERCVVTHHGVDFDQYGLPGWMEGCQADILAAEAELADPNSRTAVIDALRDPATVHVNMLSGRIAKPTWAAIQHLYGGSERTIVPTDDPALPFCQSRLPYEMIQAGMEALEKANDDLRGYVAGETIDWDTGMIVVAIFRAMCAAAPKTEA